MNPAQRQHLHDLGSLLLAHEPQVDYPLHDVRGVLDAETFALSETAMKARLAAGKHLMMDCSAGVTCLYKWAGLDDPNGLRYGHIGYTGTLLAHLPHYSDPSWARVGALVIFGPATGEHAAMVLEPGPDPWLWSHGWEGGPQRIRLSAERNFHKPPVTFLNVSGIGPRA